MRTSRRRAEAAPRDRKGRAAGQGDGLGKHDRLGRVWGAAPNECACCCGSCMSGCGCSWRPRGELARSGHSSRGGLRSDHRGIRRRSDAPGRGYGGCGLKRVSRFWGPLRSRILSSDRKKSGGTVGTKTRCCPRMPKAFPSTLAPTRLRLSSGPSSLCAIAPLLRPGQFEHCTLQHLRHSYSSRTADVAAPPLPHHAAAAPRCATCCRKRAPHHARFTRCSQLHLVPPQCRCKPCSAFSSFAA